MSKYWTVFLVLPFCSAAPAQDSTWQTINHHILGGNCASCHQANSTFARQSDLVLTPEESYQQLVGVTPFNPAAAADGLLRVSDVGGPIGLAQSYLWEKINVVQQDHFYSDHPAYGALMPMGGDPLTNGELAFVREWILHGAPETGAVADISLLEDTTRFTPPEFKPLDPPDQGFQLHIGPFDVWSSERYDREFYHYVAHETDEPLFVSQYEVSYREGSHHFILNHYPAGEETPEPGVFRDLRDENGRHLSNNGAQTRHSDFVVATQTPFHSYEFPKGVALKLPPGSGFDFNVHSVNRTGEARQGEVFVNIHTVDGEEILHVAEEASFGNFDLYIPPHQTTTISKEFRFNETRNVVQMWSHSHEQSVEFLVEYVGGERDGELLYWSNDWEHPPFLTFDPPLVMERGQRVKLTTTYRNDTDRPITYGPLSTDEMQFLFYISHPVTADINRNGTVDVRDIDALARRVRIARYSPNYDVTFDGVVDFEDQVRWVERLMDTYFGDSNLDGEFNTADLVAVFRAGEFEDAIDGNSTWATGDWNGDEEFDTSDLVLAFQRGGFEKGARVAPTVPEPNAAALLIFGIGAVLFRRTNSFDASSSGA